MTAQVLLSKIVLTLYSKNPNQVLLPHQKDFPYEAWWARNFSSEDGNSLAGPDVAILTPML